MKTWFLLALFLVAAWVYWDSPGTGFNPREILDQRPNRDVILSELRSDLEELGLLQEIHYRDHGEYSGNPSILGFSASPGVRVSLIGTPAGWSAAATHGDFPPEVGCAVFAGTINPPSTPIQPLRAGVVRCTDGEA